MEPLISVIVPAYNAAESLQRCVNSLLAQKCADMEIILVDDGSTDKTGELCARYAEEHENITAIFQENRGVSAARNAGLDIARGRYLGFVDSDDRIAPDMYSALYEAMSEHETQIAACGYAIHRYDGVIFTSMVDEATPARIEKEQALKSLIHPRGMQGFLCNKLFSRELLVQAGRGQPLRLDESIHVCEDLIFVSRCIETTGYVAYVNLPLYIYCVRDYGGPQEYNREKRISSLYALEQLMDSWTGISPALGARLKRKYAYDSYNILRAAAGAGDTASIPLLRGHLRRYLKPYLLSRQTRPGRKLRALLSYAFPNLENKLKQRFKGRR